MHTFIIDKEDKNMVIDEQKNFSMNKFLEDLSFSFINDPPKSHIYLNYKANKWDREKFVEITDKRNQTGQFIFNFTELFNNNIKDEEISETTNEYPEYIEFVFDIDVT